MELPLAAFLGPLITKHGPQTEEPGRSAAFGQIVLQNGPDHSGGGFRPQGNFFITLVVETVHFFFNNIGGLADAPGKNFGLFGYGGPKLLKIIAAGHIAGHFFQALPKRGLVRENIFKAFNGGECVHVTSTDTKIFH